uniref:Uncharacterized protein n=1 Tax=Tanacetum cinerariifolium TaxID=118510 RepID=A0A6L2JGC4_TANCI|nr:hypothetical protein [Tanacetum cinerariifolium]
MGCDIEVWTKLGGLLEGIHGLFSEKYCRLSQEGYLRVSMACLVGGIVAKSGGLLVGIHCLFSGRQSKTKAADYEHIKWIKDLVPRTMWSQVSVSYDKHALWKSHIGSINVNNSMDLRSTKNLLEMSTPNVESSLSRSFKSSNGITTSIWIGSLNGTLNDVRTALDDNLKGIQMQYLPQTIWRRSDKDRAAAMIQAIDKLLKTRRIMRSLEKFVGGRLYKGDFWMLQRTI